MQRKRCIFKLITQDFKENLGYGGLLQVTLALSAFVQIIKRGPFFQASQPLAAQVPPIFPGILGH